MDGNLHFLLFQLEGKEQKQLFFWSYLLVILLHEKRSFSSSASDSRDLDKSAGLTILNVNASSHILVKFKGFLEAAAQVVFQS